MLRRPLVLSAVLAFIEISLVLRFPQYFSAALATGFVLSLILAFICIRKRELVVLSVMVPVLLLSAVIPYYAYTKYEKPSNELILSLKDEQQPRFGAVIDECKNYDAYSLVFATIYTANDKRLKTPLGARMGCYSGYVFSEGDTVIFEGTPTQLSDIETNIFDTQSYLKAKEIFIDFPSISVTASGVSRNTSVLSKFRNYTKDIIYKYIRTDYSFDTAAVCHAVFSGDSNYIPKEIKSTFSECGLTHILCVSGMHLAILAGTVYSLLALLTVHKKARCLATIALCIMYTVFTGLDLSTVRACIMCSLGYIGMMTGRKTDGYISLFFSLLLICLISPYSIFDISLILSFCATLGIISISELLPVYLGQNKLLRFANAAAGAVLSNVGAVAFTLPVCAVTFGGISTMSVISTLAVSYIFELLLSFLLLLVLFSPLQHLGLSDSLLVILGRICNTLCNVITKLADFFSGFRYAGIESAFPEVFAVIFVLLLTALSLFIAFDLSKARHICIYFITLFGIVFVVTSLVYAVIDDGLYKVTYYRKNETDRQLSIKLGKEGFLLVNADSSLCNDYDDLPFDKKHGKNYLLIVPDDEIIISVLCENIRIFDSRFGIEKVYVPHTEDGKKLAAELYENCVSCSFMSPVAQVDNITVSHKADDIFYISVYDKDTKTEIVFADSYNMEYFDKSDICAFFTRKSENQFDIQNDTKPDCTIFFTRLKKSDNADGIINTFGEKTVTIKG